MLRCTGATSQKESDRARHFRSAFTSVRSDSPDLRRHVESRSEAGQLLHLASTIGVKHTLLAVGDRIGLTSGALVEFDDALLEAYSKCMDDLYDGGLRCFYDESVPINEAEVRSALSKSKVPLDFDTFMQSWQLWKALTAEENLPLPPLMRIIPLMHQFWNDTKCGSDVTTQHRYRQRSLPPVQSPSTAIVDRQIFTIFRELHALGGMFLAAEDLVNYNNVHQYQDSINHKATQFDTMMGAADIFEEMLVSGECGRDAVPRPVTPPTPKNSRRGTKRTRVSEEIDFVTPSIGFSPKKFKSDRLDNPKDRIDRLAADLFHNCTGTPALLKNKIDPTKTKGGECQYSCIVCHKPTRWFCTGCRQYMCHDKPRPENEVVEYEEKNKKKTVTVATGLKPYWESTSTTDSGEAEVDRLGVFSCFMHKHPKSFPEYSTSYYQGLIEHGEKLSY